MRTEQLRIKALAARCGHSRLADSVLPWDVETLTLLVALAHSASGATLQLPGEW